MMNAEQYITDRLDNQIRWYDAKSIWNQRWYKRLSLTEIVLAALIPFLAGIAGPFENWGRLAIGLFGIALAASAGTTRLYKFHEHWIENRTTAETLKHEKYLYLVKAPPYAGENALVALAQRVESVISKEHSDWAHLVQTPSDRPPQQVAGHLGTPNPKRPDEDRTIR